MVVREVPFGNSSLLYNWKNITQFYREFELKTVGDFDKFWTSENINNLELDDLIKIARIGLQRKDKTVSIEEAMDIVDEFMGDDQTVTDLALTLFKAQSEGLAAQDNAGEQKGATKAKKPPTPSTS